jgi:hypothetical protein
MRWVPGVCAYTGARIVEVCQLRSEDVKGIDGIWCIALAAEASSLKNANSERVVSAHSSSTVVVAPDQIEPQPCSRLRICWRINQHTIAAEPAAQKCGPHRRFTGALVPLLRRSSAAEGRGVARFVGGAFRARNFSRCGVSPLYEGGMAPAYSAALICDQRNALTPQLPTRRSLA